MSKAWVHLNLPRWQNWLHYGTNALVNSVKIGREPMKYVWGIALRDVEFRVHERGREKVLITGQRNVHAWVIGEPMKRSGRDSFWNWPRAVYSPFEGPTFVDLETLEPLHGAARVVIHGKDVYYKSGWQRV